MPSRGVARGASSSRPGVWGRARSMRIRGEDAAQDRRADAPRSSPTVPHNSVWRLTRNHSKRAKAFVGWGTAPSPRPSTGRCCGRCGACVRALRSPARRTENSAMRQKRLAWGLGTAQVTHRATSIEALLLALPSRSYRRDRSRRGVLFPCCCLAKHGRAGDVPGKVVSRTTQRARTSGTRGTG